MGLDEIISDQEERELKQQREQEQFNAQLENFKLRIPIGEVANFYEKISVVAIDLTAPLKVGDTIELESENDVIRQKVISMQIERVDVDEASKGDSVGIKVDQPVAKGSKVYRLI